MNKLELSDLDLVMIASAIRSRCSELKKLAEDHPDCAEAFQDSLQLTLNTLRNLQLQVPGKDWIF